MPGSCILGWGDFGEFLRIFQNCIYNSWENWPTYVVYDILKSF